MSNWFRNNSLVLYADKTKILFYNSNRMELIHFPDIYLNQIIISRVDKIKYLGLIFDRNLTWSAHIESVIKKISPYVGVSEESFSFAAQKLKKIHIIHSSIQT